jgi:uncharacterized membrane protein HdeD (DUF308 family)
VLVLLVAGIFFVILGIYVISSEKYNIVKNEKGIQIIKNEDFIKDRFYRYKVIIGIFTLILGVFSILNYILY